LFDLYIAVIILATNGDCGASDVECIELDEEGSEPPKYAARSIASGENVLGLVVLSWFLLSLSFQAIDNKKNIDRKVLDALLGAINVQVQKEPLSVRKLILDKQLVLPNTISFPPSLVMDMLIEHDPDHPLSKVITRMFGEERPKLNETEKKERQSLKLHNNAPHMTKLLLDIGQDLVQESTYCDIVHARNLPETPKNIETYKQVAAQLKPVWEALRKRNEPYKLKMLSCQVCGFKTESRMVLQSHRSTVHYKNGKYQCAMCPEFDTNEQRLMNHYLESHSVIASKEETQAKYPCLICDEDFQYKGIRDTHLRVCKKDYSRVRNIMAPKGPDDQLMINRWLWERPPIDPTILQQQQAAQQQQKRNQLAQAQQAVAQAALRLRDAQQNALQQQLLQQQQRMRQVRPAPIFQEVLLFQLIHKHLRDKTLDDVKLGAPLACSRCRERFWTYEGLERHLVMAHGLVTADLLAKAQNKLDGGRCKLCAKQYAFNMLQHLVADHHIKLCSAEIMYSCDVCSFKCSSYTTLESHLNDGDKKQRDHRYVL
uniref:C2H2-type domain-containing protein n=1 Tax=Heligmosomoides polygyrus TaxID=6339 RepID=A0A183G420_HELPZ